MKRAITAVLLASFTLAPVLALAADTEGPAKTDAGKDAKGKGKGKKKDADKKQEGKPDKGW